MSEPIAVSHGTKGWLTRLIVFVVVHDGSPGYLDRSVAWVMTGEWPAPTPQDAP